MDPLLTANDVKRFLGVSLPHVYKLAERGAIASVRFPCPGHGVRGKRLLRFKKMDVQDFIDRNYHEEHR